MRSMARRLVLVAVLAACLSAQGAPASGSYFDSSGRDDVLSGGVKIITIQTPKGPFHVWTKRVGNNPSIKVLTLHGGPGATQSTWRPWTAISQAPASSTTTTTS